MIVQTPITAYRSPARRTSRPAIGRGFDGGADGGATLATSL
jgi:hypothetical protein